jgi:hypothetical protein
MKRPQSSAGEEEEEKNKTAVDIKRGKYEHELAPKLVELIRQKKKLSQVNILLKTVFTLKLI